METIEKPEKRITLVYEVQISLSHNFQKSEYLNVK